MQNETETTIISQPFNPDGTPFIMPRLKAQPQDNGMIDAPDTDTAPSELEDGDDDAPIIVRDNVLPSQRGVSGISDALKMGFQFD